MSVNKVILVGNVGNDPEVKYIKEDVPVAKFSLATNETYKTRDGERKTDTEWHNVVVWRGLAKVVEQYVKKGSQLYIEGKISTRQYEQDGQTKYFTEVVAREMKMLGRAPEGSGGSSNKDYEKKTSTNTVQESSAPEEPDFEDVQDDDLPF